MKYHANPRMAQSRGILLQACVGPVAHNKNPKSLPRLFAYLVCATSGSSLMQNQYIFANTYESATPNEVRYATRSGTESVFFEPEFV